MKKTLTFREYALLRDNLGIAGLLIFIIFSIIHRQNTVEEVEVFDLCDMDSVFHQIADNSISLIDSVAELESDQTLRSLLEQKKHKIALYSDSNNLRGRFLKMLRETKFIDTVESQKMFYLVEVYLSGEIVTSTNFVFFNSESGCTQLKFDYRYGKWKPLGPGNCVVNIQDFYEQIKLDTTWAKLLPYSSDYVMISRIINCKAETKYMSHDLVNIAHKWDF